MSLTGDHIKAALKAAGAGSGLIMPADIIADSFNDAMHDYGAGQFDTPAKVAALVSECMMESAYFRTSEEYVKDRPYAPYLGRGFIQLTHRSNYAGFGKWCKGLGLVDDADYFVDHPTRLADLAWATLTGVYYFTQVMFAGKPLTAYAESSLQVGRAVNLGNPFSKSTPAGQKARDAAYKVVLALGPAIVPTVPDPQEPDVPENLRGFKVCSCVAEAFPALEQEMLRRGLIKHSIDIAQGGYNSGGVKASSGTHDRGGCIDILQYSDAQIQCAREMGWTFQHRTPAQGFSHHAHGWPWGCTHLSPAAQSQATQWRNGTNGLMGRGPIAGKYPINDWKTALTKWKAAEKKRADDAAAAAKAKELELPDVADIWKSDIIPAPKVEKDPKNSNWKPESYLVDTLNTAHDTEDKVDALSKKVDALTAALAALAARFPSSTPPAA